LPIKKIRIIGKQWFLYSCINIRRVIRWLKKSPTTITIKIDEEVHTLEGIAVGIFR